MCLVSVLGLVNLEVNERENLINEHVSLERFEIVFFSITALMEIISTATDALLWNSQKENA